MAEYLIPIRWVSEAEARQAFAVNDAHDEPDTGKPPCDFCRRVVPCSCALAATPDDPDFCMCSCGRCRAEPLPEYRA